MKVQFSVLAIYDMRAAQKGINVEADMSLGQIEHLIVELLGKAMPEQDAYAFMRSEFPDWFKSDEELTEEKRNQSQFGVGA